MLTLLAAGIAGAVGVYGHVKSKQFVRKRLRYTKFVEKRGMGLVVGAAAAIVVTPFAVLPLIGVGTAIAAGIGVGTGVAMGASQAKDGVPDEDDF